MRRRCRKKSAAGMSASEGKPILAWPSLSRTVSETTHNCVGAMPSFPRGADASKPVATCRQDARHFKKSSNRRRFDASDQRASGASAVADSGDALETRSMTAFRQAWSECGSRKATFLPPCSRKGGMSDAMTAAPAFRPPRRAAQILRRKTAPARRDSDRAISCSPGSEGPRLR